MVKRGLLIGAISLAWANPGFAKDPVAGNYLCTVSEKAGVRARHFEGAGPPHAFKEEGIPTRFRMQIAPIDDKVEQFRLVELAYDGTDRDRTTWHTENSILHGEYRGDGGWFTAVEDQAFFAFGNSRHKNADGDFEFYHSGFAYPGGEDMEVAVRWGRCKRVE